MAETALGRASHDLAQRRILGTIHEGENMSSIDWAILDEYIRRNDNVYMEDVAETFWDARLGPHTATKESWGGTRVENDLWDDAERE